MRKIKILKDNSIKEIVVKVCKRIVLKKKYYTYKYYYSNICNVKKQYKLNNYHTNMSFFYSNYDKDDIIKFYKKNNVLEEQVLSEADRIMKHEFEFLGTTIKNEEEINWSLDYKSGFVWENQFYRDIKIIDLENDSDVKQPWELSRFHHIFTLGKAYWLTDNEKYYQEFKNQITDWLDNNPFAKSVNWTNAMEVGIRAVNWIFGFFLFENSIKKDEVFLNRFNESLFLHGKFIKDNLENYGNLRNNHYLANLISLVFLSIYFRNLPINSKYIEKKWLFFAIKELENEIAVQVNDDGSSYETSSGYHRLNTELLLYTLLICEKNEIKVSSSIKKKVEEMHIFLADITKKNLHSPLFGDYDNGRLIILSSYFDWDKTQLNNTLGIAGIYFNNNYLKFMGREFLEESVWMNGKSIDLQDEEGFERINKAYKDGGIYLLENEKITCVVRCGELSLKGQGGHSHNDQLSIELNVNEKDFIVDPGSYTYTSSIEERNYNRATRNHSTVCIEGLEQNDFDNDIFAMKEETFSKVINFNDSYFEGEHYGYLKKISAIHNRKIKLDKNSITVTDNLERDTEEKNSKSFQVFILSPTVTIKINDEGLILKNGETNLLLRIKNYEIEDTYISIGYGNKTKTKKIINRMNNNSSTIGFEII